jgi:hypothetical protein
MRGAGGDDEASVEDDEIVRIGEDQVKVVQDGEDGDLFPACEISGERQHRVLVAQVETCGRFVEEEDASRGRDHAGRGL